MPKRKRDDVDQPPTAATERFKAWLQENNIQVSYDKISIELKDGYWSIKAAKDLHTDDCLARIPKASILSSKTSSIASVIKKEELGGGLALIAAVMHERALGPKSQWHGYLSTLPQQGEDLPLFWTIDELAALRGTEAEARAEADLEAMEDDYVQFIKPMVKKHLKKLPMDASRWRFEDFKIAASWVASRAFFVDDYHGQSLVPVADVFNHKSSIVRLKEGYQVAELAMDENEEGVGEGDEEGEEEGDDEEQEDNDGHEAGSEERGENEVEEKEEEEDGEGMGKGDKEILARGLRSSKSWAARARDAVGAAATWITKVFQTSLSSRTNDGNPNQPSVSPSSPLQLEIAICSVQHVDGAQSVALMSKKEKELEGGSMLEIIAASGVSRGSEVHNTYGEYGNAELLIKYGFVLGSDKDGKGKGINPFDEVYLDDEDVLDVAAQLQSSAELKKRVKLVKDQTSIMDKEDADPIFVAPNGKISRPLLVLLIALSWPYEELKAKGLSEVMEETLTLMKAWRGRAEVEDDELSLPPFDQLVSVSELMAVNKARSLPMLLAQSIERRKARYLAANMVLVGSQRESKRMMMVRKLRESEMYVLGEVLQVISSFDKDCY